MGKNYTYDVGKVYNKLKCKKGKVAQTFCALARKYVNVQQTAMLYEIRIRRDPFCPEATDWLNEMGLILDAHNADPLNTLSFFIH
eukprot:Awhi_evm1s9410